MFSGACRLQNSPSSPRCSSAAPGRYGRRSRAAIALVGLRGAGKSTLGRRLADKLGCPFIELDRLVEQDYGARIPDLIEMGGLEPSVAMSALASSASSTSTGRPSRTAGGIVSDPETYALLLRRTHTVWIKAPPEEHMRRVMAQGDFRPMAQNREAMADLVAILDARQADYARARPSSTPPAIRLSRAWRNSRTLRRVVRPEQRNDARRSGFPRAWPDAARIPHDRSASG